MARWWSRSGRLPVAILLDVCSKQMRSVMHWHNLGFQVACLLFQNIGSSKLSEHEQVGTFVPSGYIW